jgi:mRNA interferase YafQ
MLKIKHKKAFVKDIKLAKKRGKFLDRLCDVTECLITQQQLDPKYRDHQLVGNYKGYRECHIESDWLLIYKIDGDVIIFERTGTHSDLFDR